MNEEFSELIFESLLEEVVNGRVPPDLGPRIDAAWKNEQSSSKGLSRPAVVAEVVRHQPSPELKPQIAPKTLEAQSTSLNSTMALVALHRQASTKTLQNGSHSISRRRTSVAAALAIAAAGLLVVLGWSLVPSKAPEQLVVIKAAGPSTAMLAHVPDGKSHALRQETAPDNQTVVAMKGQPPSPEVIDIQNLPFVANNAILPDVEIRNGHALLAPLRPLEPREIVGSLNRSLAQLWQQVGVEPSPAWSDAELAQELNRFLADSRTSGELLKRLTAGEEKLNRLRLASLATESASFARNWSEKLSTQWLKASSLPLDGPSVQSLNVALSSRIASGSPWNEVIVDLLSGNLSSEGIAPDSKFIPSTVFVSALAGSENHRLLKRIGSNFLNVNLSCAKCHDATSVDEHQPSSQQVYWSTIALLKGIDAKGNSFQGTRELVDKQGELFVDGKSPNVFYDQLDGVLRQAGPVLPDGRPWNYAGNTSPREALATWIADSDLADQAIVNQTWKLVFGRHLVPQVGGIDLVAIDSRSAILDFIAEQFAAHGRDLRQLVSWVVASDAFARRPVHLNRSEWLNASERQLEKLQLSELVFASRPSLGTSSESKNLEASIAAVIRWTDSTTAFDNRKVMLGQPAQISSNNRKSDSKNRNQESKMPALSFAIHGQRPTTAEQAYVHKLLSSSRLSWEQRVEHVVAISEYYVADGRIQQLAKELLQNNGGDPKAALLDLLWSVNNSNGI